MAKPKFEQPTVNFPFKIKKRLNKLSLPKKWMVETEEGMPRVTPWGVRAAALQCQMSDRIHDIALPRIRRFILLKRLYKNRFSAERLARIDHMIELANVTCYSKLANCVLDLKKNDTKEIKKKKGWSESEWKKHMDYIGQISSPRRNFLVDTPTRGQRVPLESLLPRINQMMHLPYHKCYRRLSQEKFYRDPIKVARTALTYVISDRVKKLSAPRPVFQQF